MYKYEERCPECNSIIKEKVEICEKCGFDLSLCGYLVDENGYVWDVDNGYRLIKIIDLE